MSNEPLKLRLDRPLKGVRCSAVVARQERAAPVASVEELQLAEQARELEERRIELERREQELARSEDELSRKQQALEEKLSELAAMIGSLHEEKVEMLQDNEQEIVSFSLSITQKVLQYEIENGRYKIGEVVRSTLSALREKGCIAVRVNPRDYELARAAVERLQKRFGTTRINTVPDESIPLASCCIETESGKVFSEIPGRLKAIERTLLKGNGGEDEV